MHMLRIPWNYLENILIMEIWCFISKECYVMLHLTYFCVTSWKILFCWNWVTSVCNPEDLGKRTMDGGLRQMPPYFVYNKRRAIEFVPWRFRPRACIMLVLKFISPCFFFRKSYTANESGNVHHFPICGINYIPWNTLDETRIIHDSFVL